jgi:deoxycytidylate deaminase
MSGGTTGTRSHRRWGLRDSGQSSDHEREISTDLTSRQCRSKQAQTNRSEDMCEFPHGEEDIVIACKSDSRDVSGHCSYVSAVPCQASTRSLPILTDLQPHGDLA